MIPSYGVHHFHESQSDGMDQLDFSDDYFSLKNNTISLLFMWILWDESVGKYLHTLLNG